MERSDKSQALRLLRRERLSVEEIADLVIDLAGEDALEVGIRVVRHCGVRGGQRLEKLLDRVQGEGDLVEEGVSLLKGLLSGERGKRR